MRSAARAPRWLLTFRKVLFLHPAAPEEIFHHRRRHPPAQVVAYPTPVISSSFCSKLPSIPFPFPFFFSSPLTDYFDLFRSISLKSIYPSIPTSASFSIFSVQFIYFLPSQFPSGGNFMSSQSITTPPSSSSSSSSSSFFSRQTFDVIGGQKQLKTAQGASKDRRK